MDRNSLTNIKIVLVEPAGALNVGSIARVMKNMGLSQLVLVNPKCDRHTDEARQMAVHATDILETATIANSLPEALTGCQRAIATTARSRSLPTKLETPRVALSWLLDSHSALIFGPEDRGLSNSELKYAQRFVCINSNPVYPSLNLAQAVAVCAYELYQMATNCNIDVDITRATLQERESHNISPTVSHNVPLETLEGYYQHLETVLLEIGYVYPHTARARMDKFRRLYNRANLTSEEVAMLRGILRQIQWFGKNR